MLVIFDCDGVLVDSEIISNTILADMLGGMGWKLSLRETVDTFVGRTMSSCMEIITQHVGHERVRPDFEALYRDRTRIAFAAGLRAVPGVEDALVSIATAGLATCVASSGSHEKIRQNLKLTGLLERFDGRIFSATDVARGKPEPDLFLHAAAALGYDPRDCIVVEDTPLGVAAGRAAGMKVLAYTGTFQSDRLAAPGVDTFGSMEELPFLIDLHVMG
jgi:HAD superfamily hydrolase (TIGR01509 family)